MKELVFIKQFIFYSVGGLISFFINISLTYFLTEKFRFFYLISAILGYITSLLFNFAFQNFITFKVGKKLILLRLLKFYLFQFLSLLIFSFLVYFFTDILTIYYLFSVALSSLIVFILNFTFSKFLVFERN
ncbi:MAG: GtrA family protein [Patescibacteria group bacterium]|nr:GtrA family protein [Patescibacteria group bacterium]